MLDVLGRERLAEHLPRHGEWRPVPPVTDREFWSGVDPLTVQRCAGRAEARLGTPWPALPARRFADYVRTGNRSGYEVPNRERLGRLNDAVVAACATDDPRFVDEVIDGVWALCEQTTWCLPAHDRHALDAGSPLPDPARSYVDLWAAEVAASLAWTGAVLAPRLLDRAGPVLAERIAAEIQARVLEPYRERSWPWERRPNNWNPWIHSNLLVCTLLLDRDQDVRLETVSRIVAGLDAYVAGCSDDGGCDEGQLYWWLGGGSLGYALETLYDATGGALDGFAVPKVARIARYVPGVHLAGDRYVNFADGTPTASHLVVPDLLHRYGRRVGDPVVVRHARAMRGPGTPAANPDTWLGRRLLALADREWADAPLTGYAYPASSRFDSIQVFLARQTAGSPAGLLLAVKGGHNDESHNHNDVGGFVVAADGRPVLIDVGAGEYTAATFGPDRYSIWTMTSSYHNVPEVDGIAQAPGAEYAAREVSFSDDERGAHFRAELAGAYPGSAGIESLHRHLWLDRVAGRVVLTDTWRLDHDPSSVVLHLMTADDVDAGPSGLLLRGGAAPVRVEFDAAELTAEVERIPVADAVLTPVWGPVLRRITFAARAPAREGSWRIAIVV